jgi:hypothetical protein
VVVLDPRLDAATGIEQGAVLLNYGSEGAAHEGLVRDMSAVGTNLRVRTLATRWGAQTLVIDAERAALAAVLSSADTSALRRVLVAPPEASLSLPDMRATPQPSVNVADPRVGNTSGGRRAGAWPWVIAGTGVALLGVATAAYVVRNGQEGDLQARCATGNDGFDCMHDIDAEVASITTWESVRIGTIVAGSAMVLGGVIWWLLDAPSSEAHQRVVPVVTASGVGVGGRF